MKPILTIFLLVVLFFLKTSSHISIRKRNREEKESKKELQKKEKQPEHLPGIEIITFGYNVFIVYPIPMNSVQDPGIIPNQIFNLSYTSKKTLKDGTFKIPDTLSVHTTIICSQSMSSSEIRSEEEFSEALNTKVKAEAGYGSFFNFQGSAEYTQSIMKI